MLAVANLRHTGDGRQIQNFSIVNDDSSDGFSSENILDEIDFEDLFLDIGNGDGLPDLELDPDIFGDFIVPETNSGTNNLSTVEKEKPEAKKDKVQQEEEEEEKGSSVTVEYESKSDESDAIKVRKSTTSVKSSQGKRKVKVDWTPELHRRFVDAVEQLGLDKAVPSRILEIMGVDCLTRHNIASHLQKYRSHRKHLMVREAEAANWSQRRQMYGGSGRNKRDMRPWVVPTMAYPPPPPPPLHPMRPLHVWGHPTVDQGAIHVWPKHMVQSPPPLPWAPTPPPPDPSSFWHHHHHHRLPFTFTQGTPYYPQPMAAATRLRSTPATTTVRGTPPPPLPVLYSNKPDNGVVFSSSQSEIQFDIHPSKETVDAAIGDVLTKPWLPLPLGLKPPSLDGVLVELQRQGISNIPLSTCF